MCGWNSTARDLIAELRGDDYKQKVVVLAIADKNPAGPGVYFVRGDATDTDDLERAGIADASAALVFPTDASDESDMHSILIIMAIKSLAPQVRTVAEVNNPRNEPHFHRADVDELLVTSKIASRLLARSALYPGLSASIRPPCCRSIAGGRAFVNPPTDFVLQLGDDSVVVAQGLGSLAPLRLHDLNTVPLSASVVPSA